jgi:shikimate kinase/3-dehydroquinate synthase
MDTNLRPLLINGFMATGKSALAALVAERTGRPCVDLDARLVRRFGMSIADYFARHGEAEFRAAEREELFRLLEGWRSEFQAPPVCALGGGALLHRPTRLSALRQAVVVSLEASPKTVLERASREGGRPLLDGRPESAIAELMEQRRPAYEQANALLRTDDTSLADLADAAIRAWQHNAIVVATSGSSYLVEVGSGRVEECLPELVRSTSGLLLVSDTTVHGLYGARVESVLQETGVAVSSVALTPGEQAKNLASIERVYRTALERSIDRKGTFLALGGGVVTDMTGFAAASWLRGVRWVGVASTLLAMVDASVGGKTGVDFGPAKNSVGAFWQPSGVLCETDFIRTESERAYRGALAEVVKTALIGDPELFDVLETRTSDVLARDPETVAELVHRSVALKAWVVGTDERESGIRAWLNLGHTIGHALEAHGDYARLTHGEAVSLGLVAALRIGERLGETPRELSERVVTLLKRLGLPWDLAGEPVGEAAELLGHDKKRAGAHLRFVLARKVGSVTLADLELTEVRRQARELASSA